MKFVKVNEEVLYSADRIVRVGQEDIEFLKAAALKNKRERIRLCGHRSTGDAVHEMLIVHTRSTYVRPHKHLGKSESFHVIEGSANIVVFDDSGTVAEIVPMGPHGTRRNFFYRLSEPAFHTLLITSDFFVFHETTNGPFKREETVFAPWSPEDTDEKGAKIFLDGLAKVVQEHLSQNGRV